MVFSDSSGCLGVLFLGDWCGAAGANAAGEAIAATESVRMKAYLVSRINNRGCLLCAKVVRITAVAPVCSPQTY